MGHFSIDTHTRRTALIAVAVGALLTACSGGPAALPTAPPAPAATVTSTAAPTIVVVAPTQPAAVASAATAAPTVAPPGTPPSARATIAPTTATTSVVAKAPVASTASSPPAPKPGAAGGGGSATLSACDVITKADVEAVLGVPVTVPPAGVPGAGLPPGVPGASEDATSICIYAGQGKGSEGVMVSLGQPDLGDPAAKLPLTQAIKGSALQPLGGIGDEAATDGRHIVITRKNGRQLAVIVGSQAAGDASSIDAGKRLARIGADRL